MTVKTRFAPSPTGFLHIGGARTALFSWLYARHHQGEFVLRVEDTDVSRSTAEAVDGILSGMHKLGLYWDGEVILQSTRITRYQTIIEQLLDTGKAYFCNCSKERLDQLRNQQLANKQKPKYDNHCRNKGLSSSSNTVVRFANPLNGKVIFSDHVFGEIIIDNQELDDLILLRQDGNPTYNLAAIIDDVDMDITHIIRGDDHLNNTPKQINILHALQLDIPEFAHLPMILDADGKKMSKRTSAVNINSYFDEGFLPQAILNYLLRLGWSKGDQELFSIDEMIAQFNLTGINRAAAAFSMDKLLWFNKIYLHDSNIADYTDALALRLQKNSILIDNGPDLAKVIPVFNKNVSTLNELASACAFLYLNDIEYNQDVIAQHITADTKNHLSELILELSLIKTWHANAIKNTMKNIIKKYNLKFAELAQPVRIALSGNTSSPSIDLIMELLGANTTCNKLQRLIDHI